MPTRRETNSLEDRDAIEDLHIGACCAQLVPEQILRDNCYMGLHGQLGAMACHDNHAQSTKG
jgi:hypothetical protein